jgi:hypothetical protein
LIAVPPPMLEMVMVKTAFSPALIGPLPVLRTVTSGQGMVKSASSVLFVRTLAGSLLATAEATFWTGPQTLVEALPVMVMLISP